MKRDMELVRSILLKVEEDGNPALTHAPRIAGYDQQTIILHIFLLKEADYLDCVDASSMSGKTALQIRLTWQGHEFIEKVRDPAIWRDTSAAAKKVGSWTLSLLGDLATGYIKAKAQSLGLPLG